MSLRGLLQPLRAQSHGLLRRSRRNISGRTRVSLWTSPSLQIGKNNIAPALNCSILGEVQLRLFSSEIQRELARTEHGGAVAQRRRKLERPVSTRRPMHVVLTRINPRAPSSLPYPMPPV